VTSIATSEFHVPDISCGHCVSAIDKAVSPVAGVADVRVDLATKTVMVHYDPGRVRPDRLADVIEDCGYSIDTPPEVPSP
jgi:copper ion binding protein